MGSEWKLDELSGRYYRETKAGYREYQTDYVFKGEPETKPETREPEERGICPMSKGVYTNCKQSCVAYTAKGCAVIYGGKGNPQKGKHCPFIGRSCAGKACSWWGDYGHCIIFKEA